MQNLLLTLGTLLLVVAAIVFTAVAWGRFGIEGRALIMATVTAATAAAGSLAYRRDLTATAEAIGALTVVLLLVDAYAVRRVGLFGLDDSGGTTYWALGAGVVSLLAAGYARLVPVRSARWAAAFGCQVPLAIRLVDADLADGTKGALLAAQAGVVGAFAGLVPRVPRDAVYVARGAAAATAPVALLLSLWSGFGAEPYAGALGLVVLAAGAAATAWTGRDDEPTRRIGSGAATALLLLAAAAAGRSGTDDTQYPLVLAASALAATVAAAYLPVLWRTAPIAVASAGVGVSVLAVAQHVVVGVVAPFAWAERPWQVASGTPARDALAPSTQWHGTVVTLAVVLSAVVAAVVVSERTGRRDVTAAPVAVTLAVAALLVPLGLAWPYAAAIAWDVAAGAVLLALALVTGNRRPFLAVPLYVSGLFALLVASAWGLAGETQTVLALPAVALVLAVAARLDEPTSPVSAGFATVVGTGWVYAFAVSRGAPSDRAGFLLALAACAAAVAGSAASRRADAGYAVTAVGVVAYVVGTSLAGQDAGWLSWACAVGAVSAAWVASRIPEVEPVLAAAAAVLTCAWSAAFATGLGVPSDRAAFGVACTSAAVVVVATLLAGRPVTAYAVGGIGVVAYFIAAVGSASDPGWLSWSLAVGAATAVYVAVRIPVLEAGMAGIATLLACGWAGAFGASVDLPVERTGLLVAGVGAAGAALGGLLARRGETAAALAGAGAVGWVVGSLLTPADLDLLAWSLVLGTIVSAWLAYRLRPVEAPVAGLAAVLACGWAAAFAASRGTPRDRTGFCVVVAAVAVCGVAALLRTRPVTSAVLDVVGLTAYALAVVATGDDPGWLSWALAVGGCTALAVALRPDRRGVAWLGAGLLSAFTWVRLWLEDVRAPEAYAVAPAGIALVLGHLRRRMDDGVSSWAAYGPGLSAAFLPSLWASLYDPGLTRPLALGGAALAVVLWGAKERLQAPLVLGGGTLAVDAVAQLAPYAVQLPRWVALAAAGSLLVGLGATFEQRRRDLDRLRDRFEAMS